VYVSLVEEKRNVYRVLVRRYEEKRQFERPRYRWGCIIKVDPK
jgi:hypothetical protein